MPAYRVYTKINANIPPSSLLYDLCIYRLDSKKKRFTLLDVKQQPLNNNYETQRHTTQETSDALSVIYIMEVVLYRKTMLKTICVVEEPFTRMYSLEEFTTGKAFSPSKHENPCYFVTTGQTRPVNEGNNGHIVTISEPERPFVAQEYPIGDPRDPFEQEDIEKQIFSRFHHMDYPTQGDTSLCGSAAFFYCLQMDRPDVYAQAARDLRRHGRTKIGNLNIVPSEGCRHPKGSFYDNKGFPRVSGLDWMTLAGLRDSENYVMRYDAVDDKAAGITTWGKLSQWFEKAGYQKVFDNTGLSHINQHDVGIFNDYVRNGYWVVTLIAAGMLGDEYLPESSFKNHWVVWNGMVTGDANSNVSLKLFSWGKVNNQVKPNKTLAYFTRHVFGGLVFKPME
jgi:hypothetical protein